MLTDAGEYMNIEREVKVGEIVIFYTEILTGKVVLWCFFTSETSEKIYIQQIYTYAVELSQVIILYF